MVKPGDRVWFVEWRWRDLILVTSRVRKVHEHTFEVNYGLRRSAPERCAFARSDEGRVWIKHTHDRKTLHHRLTALKTVAVMSGGGDPLF